MTDDDVVEQERAILEIPSHSEEHNELVEMNEQTLASTHEENNPNTFEETQKIEEDGKKKRTECARSFLGKVYSYSRAGENFNVDEDVRSFLKCTGFENLIKFSKTKCNICWDLIEALALNYDEKQVFSFDHEGKVKLYIGLRDVLNILGLPIR
ncbi:hypothetical protein Salat_2500000, partial [Sesamum alatum]